MKILRVALAVIVFFCGGLDLYLEPSSDFTE